MTSEPRTTSAPPAVSILEETLELLEWPRLCQHFSTFANTSQGRQHCLKGELPADLETTLTYQVRSLELASLDGVIDGGLNFQGVSDLEMVLLRCRKGGTASGEELLSVAHTLAAARRLRRQIDDPDLRPHCSALLENVATLPELEQRLKFALEEGGRVANRASASLEDLRLQWELARQERRDRLQAVLRRWASLLQDTVIAERHGRPVLAVKAGAASQCPGMVHDSSSSGNTVFVEPKTVIGLGNRLAAIDGRIREEERRVLAELSAAVAEQNDAITRLMAVLLKLDLALARGRYGQWLGAVPPRLEARSDAPFQILELRHPLLVWQQRKEGGAPVVPVSIQVSEQLRVVAITGPNTGGKTVTLKSIGLAALMARAGMWLPCNGSPSLPWCAQVLADIGD